MDNLLVDSGAPSSLTAETLSAEGALCNVSKGMKTMNLDDTWPKAYVKGFKIDRNKVANMIEVDPADQEVDEYFRVIVHMIPRTAYKFITSAKNPNVPIDQSDGHLALVIVLEVGDDENALREMEIVVDPTIEWALPHVLVGPEVWEVA